MCFVGSFLTNHLWDSMVLFIFFLYWGTCAILMMFIERDMERKERELENLKFKIVTNLLTKKNVIKRRKK